MAQTPYPQPGSGASRGPYSFDVPKYVAGRVTAVSPTEVQVRTLDREVTLVLGPRLTEFWKGEFAPANELVEVGDFVDAYGEPNQDRTRYVVERLYANIVNRMGTISNFAAAAGGATTFAHRDPRATRDPEVRVTVDRRTRVDAGATERRFDPAAVRFQDGQWVQVVGLRLEDGSVRAYRIFA